MSSKSKNHRRPMSQTKIIANALTMFLWAYCEVHDPDVADMENMSREIQKVQEGVATGRLRLSDLRQALEDEHGWKVIT